MKHFRDKNGGEIKINMAVKVVRILLLGKIILLFNKIDV